MNMFWRLAMVWLLALALPVQASAAQAMLLCGPAHQHQAPAAADMAQSPEHHGHQAHHLEAEDPDPAGDEGAPQHKCSACASCCNAPALTPALPRLELPDARPDGVAALALAHERLLTGGLERPPRDLSLP